MIPLHDDIPSRHPPTVNYALIAVTGLIFLAQLVDPQRQLIERFGMIPARVMHPDRTVMVVATESVETRYGEQQREVQRPLAAAAVPAWLTVLTCIFLHGGWLHVIGNLWFLYVFGDNVEDRLGHVGYLAFYLVCGIAASAAHLLAGPNSTVPTIGASGAIAGVMGAYLILYPRAQVLSLIPLFVIMQVMLLPAPLFLGIWFGLQFLRGLLTTSIPGQGGVAWWAHVGGFVAGLGIAWVVTTLHVAREPVHERRSHDRRWKERGWRRRR